MEETMERINNEVENLEILKGLLFTMIGTVNEAVEDSDIKNEIVNFKDAVVQKAESKGNKIFGEAIIYGMREIGRDLILNKHFEAIVERVAEILSEYGLNEDE